MTEVVNNIFYNIFIINIEVVIDQDYDNFIKVPDVLNDGELPELKVLNQAITVKSEKKLMINPKMMGRGMNMMNMMMGYK